MGQLSRVAIAVGLAIMLAPPKAAIAAEVTALISNALASVMEELAPQFEKASGHKLKMTLGATNPLKARIEKGDAFDFTVLGSGAIDDLIKQGKLSAASRTDIARSAMGVAIRQGAPKPDITTTEAFKQMLLNVKSIGYTADGLSGTHLQAVFQRLGITDAMKPKARSGRGAELVSSGEAEIGITQMSEIMGVPRVELAGPLPPEVQQTTVFPAGISTTAKQPDGANALLKFLASPEAAKVLKAKGLEPAG
jgi:molybdate transport system substrate-binding protein